MAYEATTLSLYWAEHAIVTLAHYHPNHNQTVLLQYSPFSILPQDTKSQLVYQRAYIS